jgi:hypothetical protein
VAVSQELPMLVRTAAGRTRRVPQDQFASDVPMMLRVRPLTEIAHN